jgi:hypothetical protein
VACRAGDELLAKGIYGGIFVSCMYSAAFFEKDPRKVVQAGLACLPKGTPYHGTDCDVLTWSKQNPDWKTTWKQIEAKWNTAEPCPMAQAAVQHRRQAERRLHRARTAVRQWRLLEDPRDFTRAGRTRTATRQMLVAFWAP